MLKIHETHKTIFSTTFLCLWIHNNFKGVLGWARHSLSPVFWNLISAFPCSALYPLRLTSRTTLLKIPWPPVGSDQWEALAGHLRMRKKQNQSPCFPSSLPPQNRSSMTTGPIHCLSFHYSSSHLASVFLFLHPWLKSINGFQIFPGLGISPSLVAFLYPTQTSITSLFIFCQNLEWYSSTGLKFSLCFPRLKINCFLQPIMS